MSNLFNRHRVALADPQLCPILRLLPTRAVLIEFDIAAKIPLFLHIIKLFAPLIASSFSVTIFSDMVCVSFRMFVVQLHSTRWRWPCPLFLGDCFQFFISGFCATYCTLSAREHRSNIEFDENGARRKKMQYEAKQRISKGSSTSIKWTTHFANAYISTLILLIVAVWYIAA